MTARPWIQKLILVAGAAILWAAFCSPVHAGDHDSTLKLSAIYGLPAAADLYTTQRVIDRGFAREANPLGKTMGARIAVNAVGSAVLVLGTQRLQDDGHRRAARILKVAYVLARVGLVVNTVRIEARRSGR